MINKKSQIIKQIKDLKSAIWETQDQVIRANMEKGLEELYRQLDEL
ncbi:hypothetical protein [Brevibacillus gelatini]|nr:hypothetical protein [Brevibacillus gelatini]